MVQAAFASDSNVVDVPLELNLDISSSDIDYNSNPDNGINSGKSSGSAKNSGRRSKGLYAAVDVARSKQSAARDVDAGPDVAAAASVTRKRRRYYRCDAERSVVVRAMESRGFIRDDGDDFDIYWASVKSARQVFSPENGFRMSERQKINHFPNHYELTRKDLMVKNIKRYQKEAKKLEISVADFVPATYVLPSDYSLFADAFRQTGGQGTWIMKPTDRAQGSGIFSSRSCLRLKVG